MHFRSLVSRFVLLPIGKTYSGRNYFKALQYQKTLEETQYWERHTIENWQNKHFRKLLTHCYENVPFYRNHMKENGLTMKDFRSVKDVTKLPVMTKEILKANVNQLRALNYKKRHIRYECTGGTTGVPALFGIDLLNEYRVDAMWRRCWKYAGYVPGMKIALLWAHPLELDMSKSLHMRLKLFMENGDIFNFWDVSEESLTQVTKYVARARPEVIRGYASAIYYYLQYCKGKNIKVPLHVKSIILTSDKIHEHQKKEISEFFECEVFDEYGCREFSVIAHECGKHQGLHLAEEHFVFEVLDNGSCGCGPQLTGELLVTSLFNYAMPMLRYSLGDEVTISNEPCSCGRNLGLISNLGGRVIDYVLTESEKLIHGTFFFDLFAFSKGIADFQVRQYEKGKVEMDIVKGKGFSEQEMGRIVRRLKKSTRHDLVAEVRYVDKIEKSRSGKRRVCISEIAPKYINGRFSEQAQGLW